MNVLEMAKRAQNAAQEMAVLPEGTKNEILLAMADALVARQEEILEANRQDMENAKQAGRPRAMLDRLSLDASRIQGMAEGLRQVAALRDPIGEVLGGQVRPNGLEIIKKRVPLGVVGIIYEARPNVTADAIGLCLKTGNCALLKGGSEALHSNLAIAHIAAQAGEAAGMPAGAVGLVEDPSREAAAELMRLNGLVDVLIPRGGAGLIRAVVEQATVPVIETGTGNCHIYVDSDADVQMAVDIIVNAKTSRPAVCNAAETLLVHKDIAERFLPLAIAALREKNVEIRGCDQTVALDASVHPATEEDYATEFSDYILAVKVVDTLDDAIAHINRYGTKHSETIVTRSLESARRFQARVDAACVYVNASTRFTDGGEFGFGAEIGISTQKLHARGPMGLEELTTYKYLITGSGQIR